MSANDDDQSVYVSRGHHISQLSVSERRPILFMMIGVLDLCDNAVGHADRQSLMPLFILSKIATAESASSSFIGNMVGAPIVDPARPPARLTR